MLRFLRWFRSQDTGVKAALIGLVGTLTAALITATVTLVVALNRPPGGSTAAGPSPAYSDTPSTPDTAVPAPTTTTPHTDPPEPSPTPPPTPTPTPSRTPTPSVSVESRTRWQGTLVLDGTAGVRGWFLDDVPPGRAPVGDLAVKGPAELYGAYALARWDNSGPPTRAQCAALLNTALGQQTLDVQKGDRACVGTENMRVAYVEVTGVPDADHIDLAVTVWQRA